MKRTALILAGAAVFDLGVMAVSAQAQQTIRDPAPRSGPVSSGQASRPSTGPGDNSGHIDHKSSRTFYLKIDTVNTVRACTARRGAVVVHEGVQQCRIAADSNDALAQVSTTR